MLSIPSVCPCCNTQLVRVNDQLYCKNLHCSAKQSKQVLNYAKTLKIKGLGEKTIEKLELNSIEDIYNLTQESLVPAIGLALGHKLMEEINKAKLVHFGTFIGAFSIPLIGTTAGKKLATLVNSVEEITPSICKEAGLGEKASMYLLEWIDTTYAFMDLPVKFYEKQRTQSPGINRLSVCITGRFKGYTRPELTSLLEGKGLTVTSVVTSKTDFLVQDDNSKSSKYTKAIENNIKIVTIDELLKVLNNDDQ